MTRRPRWRSASAVALILIANSLYAPYLNRIMMCDEANTLYQYAQDLPRALLSYATPNNHILHSVLVWVVTTLAGTSAPAARFVALASALIAVALMFRVGTKLAGRRTKGSHRAGTAASAFLITNLAFADFAVNARGYSLSVCLTLLLIDRLFLNRSLWTRRSRYSLLAISFALILLLPSMLMLIAAAGAWIVWRARRQQRYLSLLLPLVTGTLVAAIFYLPSFFQGLFAQHLAEFGETDLLTLTRLWLEQTFGTPGIGLIFAAACVAGGFVLLTRSPRARVVTTAGSSEVIVTLLATTALIAVAQIVVLDKLFFARNYLFLIAPVALLGGIGASRIAARWTLPLVMIVLVASAVPLRALDGEYPEKQVIERIEQNVGVHDQVMAGPCFNAPVLHYLLHNGEEEKLISTPDKERAS